MNDGRTRPSSEEMAASLDRRERRLMGAAVISGTIGIIAFDLATRRPESALVKLVNLSGTMDGVEDQVVMRVYECSAYGTGPGCDVDMSVVLTDEELRELGIEPGSGGGDTGSDSGDGQESAGTTGDPACDPNTQNCVDPDCDPSTTTCEEQDSSSQCPPDIDSCDVDIPVSGFVRATIDALTSMGERNDELTLTWGALAPYVNCPPDAPCGTQVNVPADLPGIGALDPYIQCSAAGMEGACSPGSEIAVCRDWGTGYVDPSPIE